MHPHEIKDINKHYTRLHASRLLPAGGNPPRRHRSVSLPATQPLPPVLVRATSGPQQTPITGRQPTPIESSPQILPQLLLPSYAGRSPVPEVTQGRSVCPLITARVGSQTCPIGFTCKRSRPWGGLLSSGRTDETWDAEPGSRPRGARS